MKRKLKPKAQEPSLRDKLSANFLAAFEADFATNGAAVIEQLRQKSPEKYSEIAARLIATSEPKPDGFNTCRTMDELARKLLQSVGVDNTDAITPSMIEATTEAHDAFVARLGEIAQSEGLSIEDLN